MPNRNCIVEDLGISANLSNQSPLAVCTHTTSARGNPQKRAESPRTSRPREPSNSGLGAGSDMAWAAEEEGGWLEHGIKLMFPFSILDSPFSKPCPNRRLILSCSVP